MKHHSLQYKTAAAAVMLALGGAAWGQSSSEATSLPELSATGTQEKGRSVLAQALPAPAAEQTLGAVVVSASRSATKLEDMPLHTTIVTQEDIQKSPSQSLDQMLRNVPGLLVPGSPFYTTDPTGHNIKFRGMDKKVLVLLDGMPIHDPFYTTIQWFKVPLSSVERVEIVRGGGSSLWGNLAVGGVINIVSKRPKAGDGEASIAAGGLNTLTGAVTKNFVLSDALSLSVSGDAFKTNGYNNAPPDYRAQFWPGRGTSSAYSENFRVTTFFKPSPDLDGFVRAGYHDQNEDIGGYLYGSNLQQSPDLQASLTKTFDEQNHLQANYWTQWVRFNKYNGAGCYAAAVFLCGASTPTPATPAQQAADTLQYASSHDWNTYRERGASVMYSRESRGLLTSSQFGLDYRYLSGEDDQQSYRTPTAALPQTFRVQRTNSGGGAQEFTGIFGQFKLSPIDPLELTLNMRWDTYSSSRGTAFQSNFTNVAAPAVSSTAGGPVPDTHKSAFDPSLSARYDVSDRLALRASAYKAFRAPGLNNMFRTFGSSSITVANPELGPETLTGKEIGVDWRSGNYALGATLFTADVRDVVTSFTVNPGGVFLASGIPQAVQNICGPTVGATTTLCPGTVAYNTNGQNQRSRGLELDGSWQASRALGLAGYYTRTLTYYTSVTTTDPVNVQLPLVPKEVMGASATVKPSEKWTLLAEVRRNGFMTLNLVNATTDPQTQSAYVTFNASSTYHVNKDLDWFASVVNLTNVAYTDSSASNPQGKSFALPRVFTTGLRVRF